MQVRPLSGQPYTVWPVMWTYLNQKKLQSVDKDEVSAGAAGSFPAAPASSAGRVEPADAAPDANVTAPLPRRP